MTKEPQYKRIEKYIMTEYGVSAEHLWTRYPEFAVFRNESSRKWFALLMNVSCAQLGLPADGVVYALNVHVAPAILATILPDNAFLPGYHMNKKSWSTIILDDHLSDKQIFPIIDASFSSVAPKRKNIKNK